MNTSVTLSSKWKARFPDRCILCGHHGPGDSFDLSARPQDIHWPGKPVEGQSVVHVPACSRCRELLVRQRNMRRYGVSVAILLAAVLYLALVIWYHGPLTSVARASGLVLFLLPYLVWEALFPLPINVSATKTSITYSFEYELYAIEFLRLNRAWQSGAECWPEDESDGDETEADIAAEMQEAEAS